MFVWRSIDGSPGSVPILIHYQARTLGQHCARFICIQVISGTLLQPATAIGQRQQSPVEALAAPVEVAGDSHRREVGLARLQHPGVLGRKGGLDVLELVPWCAGVPPLSLVNAV